MKNFYVLALGLMVLLCCSCGTILSTSGTKNYKSKRAIPKGLNDYQYDFLYLVHLTEEGFPMIDSIFTKSERDAFVHETLQRLKAVKNDSDFYLHTTKYLAHFKNQHTHMFLNEEIKTIYPYLIYPTSKKWYLRNITKSYDKAHIGKQIISINEVPVKEIERQLFAFATAENTVNEQQKIRQNLLYNRPLYLKEIGLIDNLEASLTLNLEDGTNLKILPKYLPQGNPFYEHRIDQHPITQFRRTTYDYKVYPKMNLAYLQWNRMHDKVDILTTIKSYVKPWMLPFAKAYVKRQFKKKKPSKKLEGMYNPKYPIFKDMLHTMIDSLNREGIENLVIDLRNNPGGNTTLGNQLMYFLTDKTDLKGFTQYAYTSRIYQNYFSDMYEQVKTAQGGNFKTNHLYKIMDNNSPLQEVTDATSPFFVPQNRPVFKGKVYVLANQGTGSAAALLTTLLQDNGLATVIGTSVGNNPTGATTYTPMKLPRTKLKLSIASSYMERPDTTKGKIQIPDYWIEKSLLDYLKGRDPSFDKVGALIQEGK